MTESFAIDVADSLLGKLSSYAYEEASRAYGVYDDLQRFKESLSNVQSYLLYAEEKKDQNHRFRVWMCQIENICYEAEDVLDGFEFQNKRNQVVKASSSTMMKVGHFLSSHNPLVFGPRLAHQIIDVRDRLDELVAEWNEFFSLEERIDVVPQKRLHSCSLVDTYVIGRENETEEIVQLLMQRHPHEDDDGDKSLCVIPIVGIGGLGKTTLAQLVYNDNRIHQFFDLKMWVAFYDDFDIRKIIITMIESASAPTSAPNITHAYQENINHLDMEQLVSHLRYKLSGKRFLLVLDDIWDDDLAKWIGLKDLIKVSAVGSKILVTTRSNSIASMMGTVDPYLLKGLSSENCLSLFVKWVFKEGEEKKYPNLVEIGKEIVKKCGGIPLAVKTLGNSLFLNLDLDNWEFIRDSEIWKLNQRENDILPTLKLSYDLMPSHLRHCLAYFSLFPKDYRFEGCYMKNIWLAHGLLQSPNGSQKTNDISRENNDELHSIESQKTNDIARKYIDELHLRSFIQDFEDYGYTDYSFKVHDLVHDLAMYVAKEEFVVVNSHTRNIPKQVRHLSIIETDSLGHELFPMSESVRTILFPIHGVGLDNEAILDTWLSRCRYLRYLDLSNSSFETLPISIADLELLRVLDLSNNHKIRRLPDSICKLYNLQILSFIGCMKLETLPKGLGKLTSLQELYITTKQSVLPQNEFASLTNLQSLGFLYCDNLKTLFSGAKLISLETLSVESCGSLMSLPLYILPELQTLMVADCKMLNLSLKDKSPITNSQLNHLHLQGFQELETLPQWIEGAADTLHTLKIMDCPSLRMLPEYLAEMIHLKGLVIVNCPRLLSLPSGMHPLTAHLEELRICGCPDLCRKYQPEYGEYWPIIAHIKRVFIEEPREEEEE